MTPRFLLPLIMIAGVGAVSAADTKAVSASPNPVSSTPPASSPTSSAPVSARPTTSTPAGPSATGAAPAASTPARTSPTITSPVSSRPNPAAATSPRSDSSVAPSISFDEFRLISDRNIFNPNRTGRRDRTEEQPPRTDVISLVGTMDSDRGLRAFFDGSVPSYQKALHVGETVEKFTVTKITREVVDLEREGKTFSVRVGQQFRRPDGADWTLVGEDVVRREAEARAAAENKVDPSAPPVIPANVDDITRRMMERRAKELKR